MAQSIEALFDIPSDEDQTKLGGRSRQAATFDYAPFVRAFEMAQSRPHPDFPDRSVFIGVRVPVGRTAKQAKRAWGKVARSMEIHVGWHRASFSAENPEKGWVQIRPAPKQRAKSTPKNGKAVKVDDPMKVVKSGRAQDAVTR